MRENQIKIEPFEFVSIQELKIMRTVNDHARASKRAAAWSGYYIYQFFTDYLNGECIHTNHLRKKEAVRQGGTSMTLNKDISFTGGEFRIQ